MKDSFLLQSEFETWLKSQSELLCFKPFFYSSQLIKLNNHPIFNESERNLSELLENEIICNHQQGIEEILLKVLSKIEKNRVSEYLIITKEFDALRIGLLKYRVFLHHFMVLRTPTKLKTSNYLAEVKHLNIASLLNDNSVYSIPIYQNAYKHHPAKVDDLWRKVLATNSAEGNSKTNHEIVSILVKSSNEPFLEVLDNADGLVRLFILFHIISEFSSEETKKHISRLSKKIRIKTKLNEQQLFLNLINNKINKNATNPSEISEGISYKYEKLGLNNGYHFLQTAFRFVQLLQETSIPQSENYLADVDTFLANLLKTKHIKLKLLNTESNEKTFLTTNSILIENMMEWL